MRHDQRRRDRQRQTYLLYFPSTLDAKSVIDWLRGISGQHTSIAFELWASSSGFQFRLKVPWQAEGIMRQLQAHLPGLRYEREERPPHKGWTHAIELRMTSPGRSLNVYDSTAIALVGAARGLKGNETVLMQLVVSPARRRRPPIEGDTDELRDRRKKLEEPNFQTVLRLAAAAPTNRRAKYLVAGMRNALRSTQSHAVRFQRRLLSQNQLQTRIDHPATPFVFPMLLSAPELTALMAWPVGNPMIPGMPPVMSPVLHVPSGVLTDGVRIGKSNVAGHERPIAIGWGQMPMHTHILGQTGTGKSVLVDNITTQAMNAGSAVILIETEGKLYESVLDHVPFERINDVITFDFTDSQHPIGFNPLDQGDPLVAIDQLISLFTYKYGTSMWAEEGLQHALWAIAATPGARFTDVPALLLPQTPSQVAWAKQVIKGITDSEQREWWDIYQSRTPEQMQQRADPVLSRFRPFASRPELRHVFGQAHSSITMADVIQNKKILLVNLKGVPDKSKSLAAAIIVNTAYQKLLEVGREDAPMLWVMDEFADFMDMHIRMETMLSQGRKHGACFVLANQNMNQLSENVKDGMANVRNRVVLNIHPDDATAAVRLFGKQVEADHLTHQKKYEAFAQIMTPDGVSAPMTLETYAPPKRTGNAQKVIYQSRQRYSRWLPEVVADMETRHAPKPSKPLPPVAPLK